MGGRATVYEIETHNQLEIERSAAIITYELFHNLEHEEIARWGS